MDSGRILKGFWKGLGMFLQGCEIFWKEFGRSLEGFERFGKDF